MKHPNFFRSPELFAAAIEQAEGADLGGKLKLTLKGGAKTELQLKELGSFSKSAPWDCAKTDAIIAHTADKMLETGEFKKSATAASRDTRTSTTRA